MFCEVSAEEEVKAKPHEADLFTCLPAHLPPTELNATERHWPHLLQQMRIFHPTPLLWQGLCSPGQQVADLPDPA